MNDKLENQLASAKNSGVLRDYSITLGYDYSEATLEFAPSIDLKTVNTICKGLAKKFSAFNFLKFNSGNGITIKFTVKIS